MSINTKKTFEEVVHFLEANRDKKVATIMDEIYELTARKANSKTFLVNEKGDVVAIYCYYHKQWELLSDVEYGKKASSATGFNTMCKVGVRHWTRQNNAVKQVGEKVLDLLDKGEIDASEIADTKERLIAEAKVINQEDMPAGYETLEEVTEALEE